MTDKENGVSPVIGVMLMIVVTIVIAAVIAALAGGIGSEKKAGPSVSLGAQTEFSYLGSQEPCPVATLTITYTRPDGSTYKATKTTCSGNELGINRDGILFTHEGGDPIDLKDLEMTIASGDADYTLDYSNVKYAVPALGLCNSGVPTGNCGTNGYISNLSVYSATNTQWNSYTAAQIMPEFPNRYFYKLGPNGLVTNDTIIRPGDSFMWLVDDNYYPAIVQGANRNALRASYWTIATYDQNGNKESFAIERGVDTKWELSDKPSGETLAHGEIEWPNT